MILFIKDLKLLFRNLLPLENPLLRLLLKNNPFIPINTLLLIQLYLQSCQTIFVFFRINSCKFSGILFRKAVEIKICL